MNRKDSFIKLVDFMLDRLNITEDEGGDVVEALKFYEEFKTTKATSTGMTENGVKILEYMKEHVQESDNLFNARAIAEGLFMSSRSVSGAMRKLINDGYVTKAGSNPVIYSLVTKA